MSFINGQNCLLSWNDLKHNYDTYKLSQQNNNDIIMTVNMSLKTRVSKVRKKR